MPLQLANQDYTNDYKDEGKAGEDRLCEKFKLFKYILHPLVLVFVKINGAANDEVGDIIGKVERYNAKSGPV